MNKLTVSQTVELQETDVISLLYALRAKWIKQAINTNNPYNKFIDKILGNWVADCADAYAWDLWKSPTHVIREATEEEIKTLESFDQLIRSVKKIETPPLYVFP